MGELLREVKTTKPRAATTHIQVDLPGWTSLGESCWMRRIGAYELRVRADRGGYEWTIMSYFSGARVHRTSDLCTSILDYKPFTSPEAAAESAIAMLKQHCESTLAALKDL